MAKQENKLKSYNPQPAKVKQAQSALILAEGNIEQAHRSSGISVSTFKRYIESGFIDPTIRVSGEENLAALEKLAADRNEALIALMMDTAELAVDHTRTNLDSASAKDAAQIAGTMIEKARLLEGKATKKVEVDISDPLGVLMRHGIIKVDDAEVIEADEVAELELPLYT